VVGKVYKGAKNQVFMDPKFIKKRIDFNFSSVSLQLDVSESLFSSFDVDTGTRALLNSLRKNESLDYSKILDLGCGYGPIGLFLKKQDPSRDVVMSDRDALAWAFTTHNAKLNNLDVDVDMALFYPDKRAHEYTLIVSNFPAKIWKNGLEGFVYGASHHLLERGTLAIVIVNELKEDFESVIDNSKIRVTYNEQKGRHTIYHLTFSDTIPVPEDEYIRGQMHYTLSQEYCVDTAQSIEEFDTLSFSTKALHLLLQQLDPIKKVFVVEPGQGHSTIAAIDILHAQESYLFSRDALQLEISTINVHKYFATPWMLYGPYLDKSSMEGDLTIMHVRNKQDLILYQHNFSQLTGRVILCGKESLVNKLTSKTPIKEETIKGHVARLITL
jgi:16S rRNA (guanine1207-N2)-methyltransferase